MPPPQQIFEKFMQKSCILVQNFHFLLTESLATLSSLAAAAAAAAAGIRMKTFCEC